MTKQQLFDKYSINERHSEWNDGIDNWNSVEIYRIMHNGNLPSPDDLSVKYLTDFLDKAINDLKWLSSLDNWGSLFLTAKREVYRFHQIILKEL